ncbi:unnamed protein product [Schistocephalus solidus]|uniref:Integrase n=1 Tax=Schistocephalus solidus TaxID=70667 RepID=A0A183SG20_SCHSO|nr:unnamed protein product [Schistocephalus solidus]
MKVKKTGGGKWRWLASRAVNLTLSPTPHNQTTVQAGQLSDAEMGAAAGDFVYEHYVHDLARQTQAPGFHTTVSRSTQHTLD